MALFFFKLVEFAETGILHLGDKVVVMVAREHAAQLLRATAARHGLAWTPTLVTRRKVTRR